MSNILRNPNSSELIHAIEYNVYDMYDILIREYIKNNVGIEYEKRDEYIKFCSGIPFPMVNGVLNTNIPLEIAEKKIKEIVTFFEKKKMPFIWIIGPSSNPHNLEELLLKSKLISATETPGMAYNLNNLASKTESVPNLRIVEVENIEIMKVWVDVCLTAAEWPKELLFDFMLNAVTSTSLNVNLPHRAFLAYYNGKPVATSIVYFGVGVAGIYNVGTLKEARNKGIGTAISIAPLYYAKELGYETAILQSSEMGLNIYKGIGFKEYCKMNIFMWSPG